MAWVLGIDTSNYTTSVALYNAQTGEMRQQKRLLPVREGAVGQRQSEAVFGHVKALGGLMETLRQEVHAPIAAIGVSTRPAQAEGSYMPCFLTGEMAAQTAAAALGVPLYRFSHQEGHIAAAAYGADALALLDAPLLAFHVSGGTTDAVHVQPDGVGGIRAQRIARSLDLHAGQVVDRVGAMLGLGFPAGPALEQLAETSAWTGRPKPAMKGMDCCLSGVENQCQKRLEQGGKPEDVARYCLCYLRETLVCMTEGAVAAYPDTALLFAGGVMSNAYIRAGIQAKFPAVFAPPEFSADNAAGIAVLAARRHCREKAGESWALR